MGIRLTDISTVPSFGTPQAAGQGKGFAERVTTWFASLADLPRRNREAAELAQFSDRELSDIGLTRSDLDHIQSPEFAADYNQSRNSAMFLLRA